MGQFGAGRVLAWLPLAIALYLAPYVLSPAVLGEVTRLLVLIGAALALNMLVGATGLLSLGQGLFLGLGAYVAAIGTIRHGLSYWSAGLLALALSVPLAALVGILALRARHLFFGLLTMAFGQVAFVLVAVNYELTGGDDGLVGVVVPSWMEDDKYKYFFALTTGLVVVAALVKILASPFGAALGAVRDNRDRVASLGGSPVRYELAAFVLAGFVTTLFGVVSAGTEGTTGPQLFSWTTSAMLLMMVAIGGRTVFLGPIVGGLVLEVPRVYAQAHSSHADLVVGLILIACAVAFPEGLGPQLGSLLGRARQYRTMRPVQRPDAGKDSAEVAS